MLHSPKECCLDPPGQLSGEALTLHRALAWPVEPAQPNHRPTVRAALEPDGHLCRGADAGRCPSGALRDQRRQQRKVCLLPGVAVVIDVDRDLRTGFSVQVLGFQY